VIAYWPIRAKVAETNCKDMLSWFSNLHGVDVDTIVIFRWRFADWVYLSSG
jgi:hypothetical protein